MHTNLGELHSISEKDAARSLVTESALGQLSFADARKVVRYMVPKRIKAGAALIREGEKTNNDFMMLILSGDVRVESESSSGAGEMIVTVMSAGSLIGEIGMINGTARSASCIASTELAVAVLTRSSMKKLIADEAEVAARFLLAISSRLAEHLRDTTNKLKKFVQLNAMLQNEVYMLMDSQGKSEQRRAPRLSRSEMPTEPMSLATQPAALVDHHAPSTRRTSPASTAARRA